MDELVPPALYPSGVPQLNGFITMGTAFFPGGCGLHLEGRSPDEAEFPIGGLMVLGHNYDSEIGFAKSLKNVGEAVGKGTWGSLLKMFGEARIPLDECFFTNAFMGLCKGSDNKSYRGRNDPNFRAACLNFLKAQIEFQRPRLILTLGVKVPPLLAAASEDLKAWNGHEKRRSCDREIRLTELDSKPIFEKATFVLDDGSTHVCTVTAIAHPSDRRNGARRLPIGFPRGIDGEIELVRAGWALCGSSRL